ncbi:hypothetical protein PYR71_15715 [Rhizobium sp. MC63]|uniref:Uncharacterized protein n=1 Tax=Rhizobium mulingense TaxID=3031128 RepID=A0ACC6N592_9HYPH|nr:MULTISPECIES: hypothetical protein [unclassified Rhizobium]MDF0697924.1 hypothetical protein [Rhizobium sp. MC63]MEA3520625.1 hypothetical protein [Rhizobium sp. MJ31]
MRPYTLISWSVVSFFVIVIFTSLPIATGRQWASVLPSQYKINQRQAYGSTQLPNGAGTCGAVIYQLSWAQTQDIRRNGVAALPAGLQGPDGFMYGDWANTPVPKDIFERYVLNTAHPPVGLNCSHGSWEKEWRANTQKAGNYYSTNGKALILLQASELQRNPMYLAAVGYFYNP